VRAVQVGLFVLAVAVFLGALVAAGTQLGDILWRADRYQSLMTTGRHHGA
jgi:hypothetical protein